MRPPPRTTVRNSSLAYLEAAAREGKDRVVLIGIAQEKTSRWRSWPRKGQEKRPHPHMEWGLRALSNLALVERARMGEAAM
jgi:hypothetical protein